MKATKIAAALCACSLLLLAGCGKGGNANNANTVSTTNTTVTTNTARPTASPAATTQVTEPPSKVAEPPANDNLHGKVSKPEDAAQGLFNAWKAKDRAAAAKYAANVTVTHLFSEGNPEGLQFQGCDKSEIAEGYDCGYSYEGGALIMRVTGSEAEGYKVTSTSFIAD